jgi:hypothetical protein
MPEGSSKSSKKNSKSLGFRSASTAVLSFLRKSRKNPPLPESSNNKRHTPPQIPPPPTKKANSPATAQSKKTSVAAAKSKSPAAAKSKKTSVAAAKSPAAANSPATAKSKKTPVAAAKSPAAATAAKSNSPAAAKSPASANVEHCKIKKNMKKSRQHMLEKLLFTGDRQFSVKLNKFDLNGDIEIEITNEKTPLENYRLKKTKRLGKGVYGSVFLLNEVRSDKKVPVSIAIKCMVGDEEVDIAYDLKKADCDILRLSFIKGMKKPTGYFIAFMDKAEGHLHDIPPGFMPKGIESYKSDIKKFSAELINIGDQIFKQLKCLYNLNDDPSKKYLYTDLKPTNCLYYCKGETPIKVQLGDLGSAVYYPEGRGVYDFISTYTAPEYRKKRLDGHFSVDLANSEECGRILAYQLGFLIVELVEGPLYTQTYWYKKKFDQGKHEELEAKAEEILKGLSHLIKEEPDKRINILDEKYETFEDILEDAVAREAAKAAEK